MNNSFRPTTIAALGLAIFNAYTTAVQAQFNYETNNGTITITEYTGPGGDVVIPGTINGLPVTRISAGAFAYTPVTSVVIPDSLTTIEGRHPITPGAFQGCSSLTAITIPNSVTTIGIWAFEGCSSLTNVVIPDSVTSIGNCAFGACTSLTAFTVDPLNPVYSTLNGVLFDNSQSTLIQFAGGISGSYTIPQNVTNIGTSAFYHCTSLTSITIPDTVTTVGDQAFLGCSSLTAIAIPNSITKIGGWVFSGCSGLTNIIIPNSVTTIAERAFSGCRSLMSITIPCSVTSILGDRPFSDCSSLTELFFEGNAPSLGAYVFDGSTNAIAYYLPGTSGWGTTYGDRPTAVWKPLVQTHDGAFGVRTNQFGFNIKWASGRTVVVEASTTLSNPNWVPVSTNALSSGSSYFSDPEWTNHPARFYRIRSP
jgi:hypothetical protein